MPLHMDNINKLIAMIKYKNNIGKYETDFWSAFNIPSNIIDLLANTKYTTDYLINILDKIKNNLGLVKEEEEVYNIFKPYIYIEEKDDFNRIRCKVNDEYIYKEAEYKRVYPSKQLVYDNQKEAAFFIIDYLINQNKRAVSLVALPQVGKTGTFLWVSYLAMTHPDNEKLFFPEDVFIITGMSDIDWEKQTRDDMLNCIKDNVYHLGKIKDFNRMINTKRNTKVLIIIDECQIATSTNQQIDNIIKDIEKTSEDKNIEIKYVVVSATPGVILYDLGKWKDNHKLVILKPPSSYVSFSTFINETRIDYSNILDIEFLNKQFLPLLQNRFTTPKYHIIRSSEKKRGDLTKWCSTNNFIFTSFDSKNRILMSKYNTNTELNLNIEPLKHHFVIIKNFWRAGKRMNDTHVGIVYEYNEKIDYNITAQGLIARFCGNDKQSNNSTSPYFFGNIDTLKAYIEFMDSKCNFKLADYTSQKLLISDGEIKKYKPSVISSIEEGEDNDFYSKKDYMDVPRMIEIDDLLYNEIVNANADSNANIIINYLKNNDSCNIYQYISKYKRIKITIPEEGENYKKHIISVERHIKLNKPYKSEISKKDDYNNVWVAFIDKYSTPKKIYFLIYHGNKLKELTQKFNIDV